MDELVVGALVDVTMKSVADVDAEELVLVPTDMVEEAHLPEEDVRCRKAPLARVIRQAWVLRVSELGELERFGCPGELCLRRPGGIPGGTPRGGGGHVRRESQVRLSAVSRRRYVDAQRRVYEE